MENGSSLANAENSKALKYHRPPTHPSHQHHRAAETIYRALTTEERHPRVVTTGCEVGRQRRRQGGLRLLQPFDGLSRCASNNDAARPRASGMHGGSAPDWSARRRNSSSNRQADEVLLKVCHAAGEAARSLPFLQHDVGHLLGCLRITRARREESYFT